MEKIKELLKGFKQNEIAEKLKVKQPTVNNWLNGKRPIPPKRCIQIEQLTNGAVTRRDLRPDDWAEIWPELAEQGVVK